MVSNVEKDRLILAMNLRSPSDVLQDTVSLVNLLNTLSVEPPVSVGRKTVKITFFLLPVVEISSSFLYTGRYIDLAYCLESAINSVFVLVTSSLLRCCFSTTEQEQTL